MSSRCVEVQWGGDSWLDSRSAPLKHIKRSELFLEHVYHLVELKTYYNTANQ